MSGRKDADACAIRVMLADDHRATLCGIAVVLDAPFAVDWLQRMDRSGEVHGRRGDDGSRTVAGTPSRRGRTRHASDSGSDASSTLQGSAGTLAAAVAETRADAARTSVRISTFVSKDEGVGSDTAISSAVIGSPASTLPPWPWPAAMAPTPALPPQGRSTPPLQVSPSLSSFPVAAQASPTSVSRRCASSSVGVRPAAVWHPAEQAFGSPRHAVTARHATSDDGDNEENVSHALLAAFGVLDDEESCEPFARIQVRDGVALTSMGNPRNGAALGVGRTGGGVKGPCRSRAVRDDRAPANLVVTGAYSRSADLFDALSTTPCDVLVCDLAMGEGPHGDGLTMIGYLRRHYPCVKLVVHTMCLHACVLRNLQLLHVQGIVSKMDDLALVRRAVSAVHKGGSFLGPSIVAALAQAGYRESDTDRPAVWSKREAEVIRRFVNGDPVKDIAKALNRSVKTVSTQKMSAMHKAGINSNAELYQYAAANGLLLMPGVVGGEAWQWCETATEAVVSASRTRGVAVTEGGALADRVDVDNPLLSSARAP